MMPLPNRWLTACFYALCGHLAVDRLREGTPDHHMRLQGWSFKAIDYILFTHYHGDHISGLPGLLLTIGNSGRTEPVTLMRPSQLAESCGRPSLIAPDLPFPIQYLELNGDTPVLELKDLVVTPFRADHGMPCFGYSVEIRRKPRFLPEKAKALGIPLPFGRSYKKGNTVEHEGCLSMSHPWF
ncbi:MAG: MBL fold metallo-hydrolase [Clostridia bacterium]